MLNALQQRAVVIGAVSCLLIAMPATVVAAILDNDDGDGDPSNWILLAFLAILVAYLFGGAQAGRRASSAPFVNGAAAAVLAFAVVQIIFSIINIAQGDGVNIGLLAFNVLLAASTGTVGAWFGARRVASGA